MENVVNWLNRACFIPTKAIQFLTAPTAKNSYRINNPFANGKYYEEAAEKNKNRNSSPDFPTRMKKLYYKLTRETYIRETINDYKKAHKISDADIQQRKEWLCQKYGIDNSDLDTHKEIFKLNYCFICSDNINYRGCSKNAELILNNHIDCVHLAEFQISDAADNEYKLLQNKFKKINAANKSSIIAENKKHFRVVKKTGPNSNKNKTQKYKCEYCNRNFATSVAAMIAHTKSHENSSFIKIGIINKGRKNKNSLRPMEHAYNKQTGKYFYGSDAKLHEILMPNNLSIDDGIIKCRKCQDFKLKYSNLMSNQKKSKIINSFEKHEYYCKNKIN